MDESKNPQPEMAAFNFPDLHYHVLWEDRTWDSEEEMGGRAAHLLADNKKKSQRLQFLSSASGRTVRMFMHRH